MLVREQGSGLLLVYCDRCCSYWVSLPIIEIAVAKETLVVELNTIIGIWIDFEVISTSIQDT